MKIGELANSYQIETANAAIAWANKFENRKACQEYAKNNLNHGTNPNLTGEFLTPFPWSVRVRKGGSVESMYFPSVEGDTKSKSIRLCLKSLTAEICS